MPTIHPNTILFRLGSPVVMLGVLTACAQMGLSETFLVRQDVFVQAETNRVDVLWVVDDSATMEPNQERLVQQIPNFVAGLSTGSDLQLGVVTTSTEGEGAGHLIGDPPILTGGRIGDLTDRLRVGVDGSDKERGLQAAFSAVGADLTSATGPNAGFLRDDARLLVVILSDEEDCSDGGALDGEGPTSCYTDSERLVPVTAFVEGLQDLKADPNDVVVSAIVGLEDSACGYVFEGRRYLRAAWATGGPTEDVCAPSWDATLQELGRIASGIRSRFRLQAPASPYNHIEVYVDDVWVDEDPDLGFWYDADTWILHFAPGVVPLPGQTITVDYIEDPLIGSPQY